MLAGLAGERIAARKRCRKGGSRAFRVRRASGVARGPWPRLADDEEAPPQRAVRRLSCLGRASRRRCARVMRSAGSAEEVADNVDEDALAVAALAQAEQQGVLAGLAGERIAAEALEEGGALRVVVHGLVQEAPPQRAVRVLGGGDGGRAGDAIGRVGGAQAAGGEIDRAAGRAEAPGVGVPGAGVGEFGLGSGATLDRRDEGGAGIVVAGGPQRRADRPRDVRRAPPDRAVEGEPGGAVVEQRAGGRLGEAARRRVGRDRRAGRGGRRRIIATKRLLHRGPVRKLGPAVDPAVPLIGEGDLTRDRGIVAEGVLDARHDKIVTHETVIMPFPRDVKAGRSAGATPAA